MQTSGYTLNTRLVRAVLVYISFDIPATRKVCGFYGIKALCGCSKCLKNFPIVNLKTNFSGFDIIIKINGRCGVN